MNSGEITMIMIIRKIHSLIKNNTKKKSGHAIISHGYNPNPNANNNKNPNCTKKNPGGNGGESIRKMSEK